MSIVQLHDLQKKYGGKPVLNELTLEVQSGDFMVIYGTPASGKSVLVRILTGLEMADGGTICLRGEDVTALSSGERNIGYVPQSFALYPNMSVFKNIAYPLTLKGMSLDEVRPAVTRMASLLRIEELLDRMPSQLSGGQKQRVAIARGLIKETEVYVLDDPLVGLDFKLRERLIDDLKKTQQALGVTFIYVTSDALETMLLASKVAVLHQGKIVEVGTPEHLYGNPQSAVTMLHVGFPQANFVPGRVHRDAHQTWIETPLFSVNLNGSCSLKEKTNGSITTLIGFRPEHIHFNARPGADTLRGEATVYLREDLGGEEIVYLDTSEMQLVTVLRNDQKDTLTVDIGQKTKFWIDPADVFIFQDGQQVGRGK